MIRQYILDAAAVAAAGTAAFAHATLEKGEAAVGASYKAVIRVPHGCQGKPTNVVRVRIPEGMFAAKPMPKPGWTLEKISGPYERSYDNHGTRLTEGVKEVVWSGGNVPDDEYDVFVVRGSIAPDLEVGSTLWFLVVPQCPEGAAERWIEIPSEDQSLHDLVKPALPLRLIEKSGGH